MLSSSAVLKLQREELEARQVVVLDVVCRQPQVVPVGQLVVVPWIRRITKGRSASYGVATKDGIWNRGAAPLPN